MSHTKSCIISIKSNIKAEWTSFITSFQLTCIFLTCQDPATLLCPVGPWDKNCLWYKIIIVRLRLGNESSSVIIVVGKYFLYHTPWCPVERKMDLYSIMV